MLTKIKRRLLTDLQARLELFKTFSTDAFEKPKSIDHGDLSLPVFAFAKQQKRNPADLAKDLAAQIKALGLNYLQSASSIQGFINFKFRVDFLQTSLFESVSQEGDGLGYGFSGKGRVMTIDFSSPNVAKPMSIGHLRATVIGQAIYNLALTQGYKVIGINHLGDWGVQFGKLAWAFQNWGHEFPFDTDPFKALYDLYVRFHERSEQDPTLDAEGSKVFLRLEQGDPQITALWKKFVDISMVEYQRLWSMLGVHHDVVQGESFYNSRLRRVEDELEKKSLLVESDGAMVVKLENSNMPPCLIRKSDGASLYATRDLASAIYRVEDMKADLNLYVVGVDQTLHFRQVFKVLEMMGYGWAKSCHHIAFGLYKFKDLGRMSTRKGNVIFLEDVLNRAVQMVREIIEQKNPNLENKEVVAQQVGVGAIIFNDLVNDRLKNVDFDWDRVLDFEGDSGPFVQYSYVRTVSLLKKYGKPITWVKHRDLDSEEERKLMLELLNLDHVLSLAFTHFKPHLVAGYVLDVARAFSHFYHRHRILGEDPETESARMALVQATSAVLRQGLRVLNMAAPEAM